MQNLFIALLRKIVKVAPLGAIKLIGNLAQEQIGQGYFTEAETEVKFVVDLIEKRGIKKVYALDIGANKGDWSGTLLRFLPNATIDLYEPNSNLHSKLITRFEKFSQVSIHTLAISDVEGLAELFSDSSESTLASLQARDLGIGSAEFDVIEKVEVSTIKKIYESNPNSPNILKVDVEGYEFKVLVGSENLLKNFEIIQFEFGGTDVDTRVFFRDFWKLLSPSFDFFRISPRGLLEIRDYTENDEVFRFTNYICVRR